jgi:hypothetical protein
LLNPYRLIFIAVDPVAEQGGVAAGYDLHAPGRTRMRSPGLAVLTASLMVVKSPRWKGSTTWVGGSVLAVLRNGAACGARGTGGPARSAGTVRTRTGGLAGWCQNVSRIRVARRAMALRVTGEVAGSNRSSRQSACCLAARVAVSGSASRRLGSSISGVLT